MMKFRCAIFDMDGTLLDSIPYWNRLAEGYMRDKGLVPSADLDARMAVLSLAEAGAFLKKEFAMKEEPEEITGELMDRIRGNYAHDIVLKPGVRAVLERLRTQGIRMCVATASAMELGKTALERNGILDFFDFLLDCRMAGAGKTSPAVYQLAAEKFGALPSECVVFEDAVYALRTAHEAGFWTIGVQEASEPEEEARKYSSRYVEGFEELLTEGA